LILSAVTAVFKGTPKNGHSILLRSYISRKEPPPEFNCTIWQAGRATCATGLAFKPIQIGNSVFVDEGAGKYNPSEIVLEESAQNEWPGRDTGVFVSLGTGKRPGGTNNKNSEEWWEGFVGGTMGNFAEARRRLIAKIEGCEVTHQQMLNSTLGKYGVPLENYCRLNVEVGVGDFGMNEWDRLSDININTHQYLSKPSVQRLIQEAAARIGKIELTKRRLDGHGKYANRGDILGKGLPITPPSHPDAVELPAEDVLGHSPISPYYTPRSSVINPPYPNTDLASSQERFMGVPSDESKSRVSAELPDRRSSEYNVSPRRSGEDYGRPGAPPIPPKTPIYGDGGGLRPPQSSRMSSSNPTLPYPDFDGPPPMVSKLRKPQYNPG
jgi:hypothetical protein